MSFNSERPFSFSIEFNIPRERIILLCPECGVAERVDKQRWTTQSIFNNNPPVCHSCGSILVPFEEEEIL